MSVFKLVFYRSSIPDWKTIYLPVGKMKYQVMEIFQKKIEDGEYSLREAIVP